MSPNISKYITYDEAVKSPTAIRLGIKNVPTADQVLAMQHVAENVFDPVREFVGGALAATSFFRSPELNKAIGGSSSTSQHMKGEAIDIDADMFSNGTNLAIFHYIRTSLEFDQLILEYPDKAGRPAWVHVSLKRLGPQRREILVKLASRYINYADWKPGQV